MATISSRFAVAVHLLAYLAWKRGEPVSSERLAGSASTNPVVVRRIVGLLRDAGLVSVQAGAAGGAALAREPETITLLEVYRAVQSPGLFAPHPQEPCRECGVGANIGEVLSGVFGDAEAAVARTLERVTLREVGERIAARLHAGECARRAAQETVSGQPTGFAPVLAERGA